MSDPNQKPDIAPEVIEELAQAKQAVENLANEIKELRSKKNEEIEELKKKIVEKPEAGEDKVDVHSQVEKVLNERHEKEIEIARKEAIEEFRNSLPDFSADNDPGDIKFKAFQKELNKFNLSDLRSKEEVKARLKEVHDFMNRGKQKTETPYNPYAASPKSGGAPADGGSSNLSDKEKILIRKHGFSEEKYLKLRDKQPGYIATLLRFVD